MLASGLQHSPKLYTSCGIAAIALFFCAIAMEIKGSSILLMRLGSSDKGVSIVAKNSASFFGVDSIRSTSH